MLMSFECFVHEWLTISAQIDTISSKSNIFEMFDASTLVNEVMTSLTNSTSSTLFLISVLLQVEMTEFQNAVDIGITYYER